MNRTWTVRIAGAATASQVFCTCSGGDGLDTRRERLIATARVAQAMGARILAR